MISTGSSAVYHELQASMRPGAFRALDGTPWPVAPIDKPSVRGQIELKPPFLDNFPAIPAEELEALTVGMHKQASELSGLEADMLDALTHEWIMQAQTPDSRAVVDIDALLRLRGIQPKKSGSGRRGGYEPEQRREVVNALARLQNIALSIETIDTYGEDAGASQRPRKTIRRGIKSRAFVFTTFIGQNRLDGSMDVERVTFTVGELFALYLWGSGRQTALLSAKALHYDPYRQAPEKAITRYLSYLWRVRATKGTYRKPLRVSTLLEHGGLTLNTRKPSLTLARLAKVLDTLQSDGVISTWRYDNWELGTAPPRGWAIAWLDALISIEPPADILEHYTRALRGGLPMHTNPRPLPERLRESRGRLGLSQADAAAAVGLTQQTYSRAERGAPVSTVNRAKLEAWLSTAGSLGTVDRIL